MKKIKKEDISQEVYDLYDAYAHNQIDRRKFMERLSVYAVGGLTVSSLMSFILPDYKKIQVPMDDKGLKSEFVKYQSPKGAGEMNGLLSFPKKSRKKMGGIIVVHENRGLNPHIQDVGRRAAKAGFISLAPDALYPLGGYPGTDDEGRTMQRKRDRNEMLEDFIAAYDYLLEHPKCNGNIGVVGFCFGGWISNMMAVRIPGLKAAAPFYGGQPADEDVQKINAPLLLHYASLDERVNSGWPDYEMALKKYDKEYDVHFYADCNHGFHNDTTPRYDKENAKLAWKRTVDFFDQHLS